jgi:ATP phosphoribosyltransferase regulatory subunit
LCTGSFKKVNSNLDLLNIDQESFEEIKKIREIAKAIKLNNNDNLYIDFSEIDEKNYHSGIRFTFFAENVRGEVASGGRYLIKNDNEIETATGFTCFMDTIIRASSFENFSKKILIPFSIESSAKLKLMNEGYVLFTIFENLEDLKKEAINYGCNYYLEKKEIKKI